MKHLNNIFTVVALFIIVTTDAKQVGKKTTAAPVITQPIYQPTMPKIPTQPQQPAPIKSKTFTQLRNDAKNATNVWDNRIQVLNASFVNNLIQNAQIANITADELDFLLKLARDYHAQFTGSDKKDAEILHSLETQRIQAINSF